jgi:hypothetical protein
MSGIVLSFMVYPVGQCPDTQQQITLLAFAGNEFADVAEMQRFGHARLDAFGIAAA